MKTYKPVTSPLVNPSGIKASDITDCGNCPLENSDYCKGVTSSPGGNPIEPPCTSWSSDDEITLSIFAYSQIAYEEMLDRKFEKEQKLQQKKEEARKKRREAYIYCLAENKELVILRRRLRGLYELKSMTSSLTKAFNITNEIMQTGKEKKVTPSIFEKQITEVKEAIKELKKLKKVKLKELRKKRNENL